MYAGICIMAQLNGERVCLLNAAEATTGNNVQRWYIVGLLREEGGLKICFSLLCWQCA